MYILFNMLKIKCKIKQQYLKTVDLHFVKSEYFSLTWSYAIHNVKWVKIQIE